MDYSNKRKFYGFRSKENCSPEVEQLWIALGQKIEAKIQADKVLAQAITDNSSPEPVTTALAAVVAAQTALDEARKAAEDGEDDDVK